jgi:hypothetical protein
MEGGKCISTKTRLTTTSAQSESILAEFKTLLHIRLKILKILITTIQGSAARRPCNASGKNCFIKT